jgi:hypothetical protein
MQGHTHTERGGAALSVHELQVLVYMMHEFVGHDRHNLKLQIATVFIM